MRELLSKSEFKHYKHYNNKAKMIKRRKKNRVSKIMIFQRNVVWCDINVSPNSTKCVKESLLKEMEEI